MTQHNINVLIKNKNLLPSKIITLNKNLIFPLSGINFITIKRKTNVRIATPNILVILLSL
jgi:hypothetical protein